MPESKSVGGLDVKRCLVVVRYRKLADEPWRRIGQRPEIETYMNDVSEQHLQPQVERITPSRVVVRVFDEQAVDLTKLIDRLGDYSRAVNRARGKSVRPFARSWMKTYRRSASEIH